MNAINEQIEWRIPLNIAVAILAGGESRRFGSRKEQALWQGKRLIDWTIQLAEALSQEIIFIGAEALNPHPSRIPCYSDRFPGNGPLGGIEAALHHSPAPWIATLPCDMPMMSAEVYALLAAERQAGRPIVAVSHSGLEPLICLWPKTTLPYITSQLEKGKNGPIPVLDALQAIRIPMQERMANYHPHYFLNINTRHDLQVSQQTVADTLQTS